LAAKHLFYKREHLASAVTAGAVLPTGRTDDPDNLTDLPFGDGQTDYFAGVIVDEPVAHGLFFNQYLKYIYQSPSRKTIRLKTDAEPIEVPKQKVGYKLGDKVEAGVSIQSEPDFGLIAGLGADVQRKYMDRYDTEADVRKEIEKETDQQAYYGSARLGYSTVPAFSRGEFKVPANVSIEYRRPLQSRFTPAADLTQIDLNIYF
jgi:hypothetical protein